MTPDALISGTWKSEDKLIKFNLPLIIFEEDGSQIMYCPALDVSGYGDSEEQAKESFEICLGEFLLYTDHKKTFHNELQRLGWKIKKSSHKPMVPPDMSELLRNNENFSRIFNNFPFRKIDSPIALPAQMSRLSNIPLRIFREFLEDNGLKIIRNKGGHEIWAGKSLQRPIVLQSHKTPVPEFIVRQSLRALNKTEQDFLDFFSR